MLHVIYNNQCSLSTVFLVKDVPGEALPSAESGVGCPNF